MGQEEVKRSIEALEEFQRENRKFVLAGNIIRFVAKTNWKVRDDKSYSESNIVIEWDFEPGSYGHISFIDPERSKKRDFVYHRVFPETSSYAYDRSNNTLKIESGRGKIHVEITPMRRQNTGKKSIPPIEEASRHKQKVIIEVEPNTATTIIGITRRLLPAIIEYMRHTGEEAGLSFKEEYYDQMEEIFDEIYEKCIAKTFMREGAANLIEVLNLTGQFPDGKEN